MSNLIYHGIILKVQGETMLTEEDMVQAIRLLDLTVQHPHMTSVGVPAELLRKLINAAGPEEPDSIDPEAMRAE